jgi:hypothetical protein
MVPAILTAELLRFEPEAHRATQVCAALTAAAPAARVQLVTTRSYRGSADLLVVWGPGHPARFEPMRRHQQTGRHVICLDLSYWQRDTKFRVSIDAAHPQAWVLRRDWPSARWVADAVSTANLWNPSGPVIVAGLGRKARVQYGAAQIDHWEAQMIAAARAQGRDVRYRRKQIDAPIPPDVALASDGPIESVLTGAGAVITWHSNVAVDAIRLGIPAVCVDGAASAVCPSMLTPHPGPLDEGLRRRFLQNLAWFQWGTTPTEARGMWRFVREVIS